MYIVIDKNTLEPTPYGTRGLVEDAIGIKKNSLEYVFSPSKLNKKSHDFGDYIVYKKELIRSKRKKRLRKTKK